MRNALRAVGLVYLASWIVGLLIWPVSLATNATGAIVISTFTGHTGSPAPSTCSPKDSPASRSGSC